MLRIALLVLIELHHCLEFKTLLSLALHLEHIQYSEHLAAEEFILGVSTDVLERQIGDLVLLLYVLYCLYGLSEWHIDCLDILLVIRRSAIDSTLIGSWLLLSHTQGLLLLIKWISSKASAKTKAALSCESWLLL